MFSLSWHRTSSKPNVNFRLFLFCLTCISFLLGVNCFAAFLSSYPFCLLSPLHNHHFTLNDELVICSLNVRGLSNSLKRRETFRWLNMKKIRQFSDQEGRYIIIDMKIDKILTLVNIYAPNNDNPTFFQNLLDRILSFECEEVIMGGDFNLVMDVQKDKKGGNVTMHRNSLKEVQNMVNSLDLIDAWRTLNPDAKRFTWQRTKPEVHCRLDYLMISSSLTTAITNADILPGYKTDHSLITIHLASNSNPRGPGFWKLNRSFLLDSEYIELIKKTIDEVAEEYRNNDDVDAILLWDTMKMQIRSSSLKYAREKKAKIKSKENTLESDISSLRKKLEEENPSDAVKSEIYKELDIKTLQLEKIAQYQTRGAILRSKARWYNEGEKNTKYFLNMQKRHFNKKTIKQLQSDKKGVIDTDDKILQEAKSFVV